MIRYILVFGIYSLAAMQQVERVVVEADEYEPALIAAVKTGSLSAVQVALARRHSVGETDKHERTALHWAAAKGEWVIVKLLLAHESPICSVDERGDTPLHCAVASGSIECVESLCVGKLDTKNKKGLTSLAYAIEREDIPMVKLLLSKGADPHSSDHDRRTALHRLAKKKEGDCTARKNIALLLIEQSHDIVDMVDLTGNSPLHYAALLGNVWMVQLLLGADASLITNNVLGHTPLHAACIREPLKQMIPGFYRHHLQVIALLVEKGAPINEQARDGRTPLHYAALSDWFNAVALLLQHGADSSLADLAGVKPIDLNIIQEADVVDCSYWSDLHEAAFIGDKKMVERVTDSDPFVDKRCVETGETPLHCASYSGHTPLVEKLLTLNASPTIPTHAGDTPLHYAARAGHTSSVALLLDALYEPQAHVNKEGKTALHVAAAEGFLACSRLLVDKGIDALAVDNTGRMALHYASANGHPQVVEFLLTVQHDLSWQDCEGYTPLDLARMQGHQEILQNLQKAQRAEPEKYVQELTQEGITFNRAVEYGDMMTLSTMVHRDERWVEFLDEFGRSPLHRLALYDEENETLSSVVAFLLDVGADANLQDDAGCTPLHYAALKGHLQVCRLLREYHATVHEEDNNGKTAVDYACLKGHRAIVVYLLDEGADPDTAPFNVIDGGSLSIIAPLLSIVAPNNGEYLYELFLRAIIQRSAPMLIELGGWCRDNTLLATVRDQRDRQGNSLLHHAVIQGAEVLDAILQLFPSLLLVKNNRGRTALHEAVLHHSQEEVDLLARYPVLHNLQDAEGKTALYYACDYGDHPLVVYLLKAGAEPTMPGGTEEWAPLHVASWRGHSACVSELIAYHASVEQRDSQGMTPLHLAAYRGHLVVVHTLLTKGASPHALNDKGLLPLHGSVACGHVDVAHRLLKMKGTPFAVGRSFRKPSCLTPLHCAVWYQQEQMVDLLIPYSDIHAISEEWSLLDFAIDGGSATILKKVLDAGVVIDDERASSSFYKALQKGYPLLAHACLVAHVRLSTEGVNQQLRTAFIKGDLAAAEQFFSKVQQQYALQESDRHYTYLDHQEDYWGSTRMEQEKIDLTQVDTNTRNIGHWAAIMGHTDCLAIINRGYINQFSPLPEKKFLLATADCYGCTPLHYAIFGGHFETAMMLIAGKEVTISADMLGRVPLHYAAMIGDIQLVQGILSYHNDSIHTPDAAGRTPLHWSALHGHSEVCSVLIAAGARLDVTDNEDKTPQDLSLTGNLAPA